eukprot:12599846-Ditylum_brightwellii.AAC.1
MYGAYLARNTIVARQRASMQLLADESETLETQGLIDVDGAGVVEGGRPVSVPVASTGRTPASTLLELS